MRSLILLLLALLPLSLSAQEPGKKGKAKPTPAPFSWVAPLGNEESLQKGLSGTLKHGTLKSSSMGVDVGYYIYLPPGYEGSEARYPVVYHLHGGRPGGEDKAPKLVTYVDAAIKAGTIEPTIYVFPNGGPMSWYDMLDREQGMGESVFVKEVVPHIDEAYRTWGTREGRALEGYSQGGRGTTRIMFKHPELFLSVAPGGSGYATEKSISENDGYESDTLRFLPIGYNTWDLARVYAARTDKPQPEMDILIWDGTKCFNYEGNQAFSAHLNELGLKHETLWIEGVPHTATGSYDVNGAEIMGHHQRTFAKYRK